MQLLLVFVSAPKENLNSLESLNPQTSFPSLEGTVVNSKRVRVCACVRACVRAYVCECVCVCVCVCE